MSIYNFIVIINPTSFSILLCSSQIRFVATNLELLVAEQVQLTIYHNFCEKDIVFESLNTLFLNSVIS